MDPREELLVWFWGVVIAVTLVLIMILLVATRGRRK